MTIGSNSQNKYNATERLFLWFLAAISFFGLNVAFGYGLLFQPETIMEALKNPIAFAFICEAFLLMAAFAYLLSKWGVSNLHWRWFVLLSILGTMGFALPIVLLWQSQKKKTYSGNNL